MKKRDSHGYDLIRSDNCDVNQWRTEGGRGVLRVQTPRNSEVLTKLRRIPSSVENTSVTTLDITKVCQSRTGLQIERNAWLGGYRPPDSRSLCPLSTTEFVEPPLPTEQNSWVRHWCKWNKIDDKEVTNRISFDVTVLWECPAGPTSTKRCYEIARQDILPRSVTIRTFLDMMLLNLYSNIFPHTM
jgi:hypothetical protein